MAGRGRGGGDKIHELLVVDLAGTLVPKPPGIAVLALGRTHGLPDIELLSRAILVAEDCLEPVRHRLRQGKKMLRSSGPDYLGSMLIDG